MKSDDDRNSKNVETFGNLFDFQFKTTQSLCVTEVEKKQEKIDS